MPDFENRRVELQQARIEKEAARLDLFHANEQLKSITTDRSLLDRAFNPNNPDHVEHRQQLAERQLNTEGEIAQLTEDYESLVVRERASFVAFAPQTDLREQAKRLDDAYPCLLLPVRLETRFKTVSIDGITKNQLWVRVYPDDCAIDTFEATLSTVEVKNAQTYWSDFWRAGKFEDQLRGAWRGLVSSHGSGRAAWIIKHYQPLNLDQKPTKALPTDIILTIATETPLSNKEQEATIIYWKAVWLADGNRSDENAARQVLIGKIGNDRAAAIIQNYQPRNLDETPKFPIKKAKVAVKVAFLIFPKSETVITKQQSWSQAPKVNILPDRFVLIGYSKDSNNTLQQELIEIGNPVPSPLIVGPNPSAPAAEQLMPNQQTGDLFVGEDMKWMTDFDRAIEVGMGFKVDLSSAQATRGFDRMLVLGLRLSADAQESKTLLETLLQHHHNSRSGFSLIPQGTPTNNTEKKGAGFSRSDDADDSFDEIFKAKQGANRDALFTETSDPLLKRDGQWLAESLGIDSDVLKNVRHSGGTDQSEAKAMNTALWPATLGYMMGSMMTPVFDRSTIESTRDFFNNFVSGRGSIPAVRIGSQPYGILPTTVFSRMSWMFPPRDGENPNFRIEMVWDRSNFLRRLYELLSLVDRDWENLVKGVSYVGKPLDRNGLPADAHKILLDILGLHSGSIEYHQRYAESLDHLFNLRILTTIRLGLRRFAPDLSSEQLIQAGMNLLKTLGYQGEVTPDVLKKFFLGSQNLLKGPIVDDRPLSETDLIRPYTPNPDNKNYIQWLIDAANTSLDKLNQQTGFIENKSPIALLYIYLHHALKLGYWDSSIRAHLKAEILTAQSLNSVLEEPNFIHVGGQSATSESRWQYLYKTEARITSSNSQLVSDYITQNIGEIPETLHLTEQIEALKRLNIPTARLERLFSEHIDCCSYRLDAWWQGLVNYQLEGMRNRRGGDNEQIGKGLYLGAYSWLENIRPENKPLTSPDLTPELQNIFNKNSDIPIVRDGNNEGYIHAPSLNHAVTAAVLRNGYLSNNNSRNTNPNQQPLAVNLSSERVRLALSVLEGIRNGQSLGALLGYQLERGLHDRYQVAEVDEFILKLRKAFPLRADNLKSTKTEEKDAIEAIEARNVVDGLSLVNHIKQTGIKTYPFGKPDTILPSAATPAQKSSIDAEVDRLLDIHDAISDLAIAESVHQAVQGNYDRAAATLDTYSKGNFPPEPDVVQTPRSGITLTHRVGLHLEAGISSDPLRNPLAQTPRAQAEPALNQWLTSILPLASRVVCKVGYYNSVTDKPILNSSNTPITQTVTQENLQIQPIDFLYLLRTDNESAMTELDDRIILYVVQTFKPRPNIHLKIQYTDRLTETERVNDKKISFFELAPMIHSLRALILRSRPLKSSDISLQNQVTKAQEEQGFIDLRRIDIPLNNNSDPTNPINPNNLTQLRTEIEAFRNTVGNFFRDLDTLSKDVDANKTQILAIRTQIITNVDNHIATAIDLLARASRFGIPQAGWGFILDWKRRTFNDSLKQVSELVDRWKQRSEQFVTLLASEQDLPTTATDRERFDLLQQAERLVSTSIINPLPATPSDLRTAIRAKRTIFLNKSSDFSQVLQIVTTDILPLLTTLKSLLPIADFDLAEFDVTETEKQIILFTRDLATSIDGLLKEIDRRIKAVEDQLSIYRNNNPQSTLAVQALQDAAKALFGDEFQLIPEIEISPDRGAEWENSLIDSQSGSLTNYLTETVGIDFPVDNWLYGAARVREKIHHWEQLVMLTGAFGRTEPELQPIQLPYKVKDHWLALQFPYDPNPDPAVKKDPAKNYQFDGDRLLYTAHYSVPFDRNKKQCGLLLDEWTEVIPSDNETTGIAFHYDRPNSEPPQTMLLVTPPEFTGSWQWQDLVDALNETLDMAKKRAVEPKQIDATPYARILPATIMAATLYQISISANLAVNNKLIDALSKETL
jgi:hypothetical protein